MSDSEAIPVLRDLQGLLRKSIGKDVVVVNYKTSLMLAKGENYGSTMLKVEAMVKKTKDSPAEAMHFVAKMEPNQEYQKEHYDLGLWVRKEIVMIETLGKCYRQLEEEAGIKKEDQLNGVPKLYGGRLTMNEKNPDKADEDAVVLLDNLKVRGYDTEDRFKGFDYEHMKFAIIKLARLHALGVAFREKKPKLFDAAKKPINAMTFVVSKEESIEIINRTVELLCADSRFKKYEDLLRPAFEEGEGIDSYSIIEQDEPWVTIIHGDTWCNNMLFHHADNGKVDDIKFVDYALSRICNVLRDVLYLLGTSSSPDVINNHFDEMLEIYHTEFLDKLIKLGCDVSPFSKKIFEEEMRRIAKVELARSIIGIKFATMEVPKDMDMSDIKSSVILGGAQREYYDRSWRMLSKFVEKGWF